MLCSGNYLIHEVTVAVNIDSPKSMTYSLSYQDMAGYACPGIPVATYIFTPALISPIVDNRETLSLETHSTDKSVATD